MIEITELFVDLLLRWKMIVTLCVRRLKWLWNELPVHVNVFQNPILSMTEFEDYSVLRSVILDFVSFASYGNVVRVGDNVLELILIDWLFSPESVAWCYKVGWGMMIIFMLQLSFDSKWWRFLVTTLYAMISL